jgi:ABC-type antimicrobial peptide transport system permease subunit
MIPPDVTPPPPSDLDLRVAPGLDQARTVADIRRRLGDTFEVTGAERPTDLVNFGRVQNLPLVMSGLLAILGAATLAHTLLTSIRRRRRDLSILKTLGFSSRQVRWTVSWQATTFAIVALAIGLPVGTAAGRALWSTLANHLGAVSEPVTPLLALSVTVPGAVLVANVVAAVPAAFAGRMHPAVALRTE